MMERIGEHIDRTRTARHRDRAYFNAINEAIWAIVKDRVEPIRVNRRYSVQNAQRISDELYTLVRVTSPTITGSDKDVIVVPTDYFYYLMMYVTIGGVKYWCTKTTYNELGPLKENPFSRPSDTKPYFTDNDKGFKVFTKIAGIFTTAELTYVKNPATVSIGEERDKLTTGATLTNAVTYYVYEDAVYSGTTYYPGEIITGTGAALTSGIVVINTKIVNCDLPVNMHEEVALKAAAILSGNVEDYNKKADFNNDVERG